MFFLLLPLKLQLFHPRSTEVEPLAVTRLSSRKFAFLPIGSALLLYYIRRWASLECSVDLGPVTFAGSHNNNRRLFALSDLFHCQTVNIGHTISGMVFVDATPIQLGVTDLVSSVVIKNNKPIYENEYLAALLAQKLFPDKLVYSDNMAVRFNLSRGKIPYSWFYKLHLSHLLFFFVRRNGYPFIHYINTMIYPADAVSRLL